MSVTGENWEIGLADETLQHNGPLDHETFKCKFYEFLTSSVVLYLLMDQMRSISHFEISGSNVFLRLKNTIGKV